MNRSINSSAPLSPLLPLPLITAAGAACHGRHLHPCQQSHDRRSFAIRIASTKLSAPCCQRLFVVARSFPPLSPCRRHTPVAVSSLPPPALHDHHMLADALCHQCSSFASQAPGPLLPAALRRRQILSATISLSPPHAPVAVSSLPPPALHDHHTCCRLNSLPRSSSFFTHNSVFVLSPHSLSSPASPPDPRSVACHRRRIAAMQAVCIRVRL